MVVVPFPPMIRYENTRDAGRGVFATRAIDPGVVIERVPVIVIPESERRHIDETILDSYAFDWRGRALAIVLGLGSIYNHSLAPNAMYVRRYESLEMEFISLAPIAAGEEVLINYNGDPADQTAKPLALRRRVGGPRPVCAGRRAATSQEGIIAAPSARLIPRVLPPTP